MPEYSAKLFTTKAANLIWGVTPGSHVAHLIDPEETPNYTEISQDAMSRDKFTQRSGDYDAKKVSPAEAYNNKGDNKTAKFFRDLAVYAEQCYEREGIPDSYKDVLIAVKKIVTASGRQAQQDAIAEFKKKAELVLASERTPQIDGEIYNMYGSLLTAANGSLETGDYTYDKNEITEPDNTTAGMFGFWTKTNDVLFPHEPSPNDIKQGFGLNDCFMLAPLAQIAAEHPEKIREMMKDNEDGTVTVRFFKPGETDQDPKVPVFITVNKTVNKLAGSANIYASSALWVQMAEKAYEKYLYSVVQERRGVPYKHSFESINWSYTDEFLNSIDPVKTYVQNDGGAGFSNYALKDYYAPNANTNREYLPSETELYNFLEKHVNQEKETITASNSGQVRANDKFARAHGVRVRHIYSIMGVFEKDGKKYVQVRDPRALFRSRYDENGKLINDQSAIMGTLKGGVSNMGTFNLELIDFLKVFDSTAMESGLFYKEYYPMVQSWASKETEKQAEGKGFFDDDLEIIGSDKEAEEKAEPKAEEAAPEEARKEAKEAEPELKNPAVDEYAFDSKKDGLAYEFENLDFEDVLGTDGKISSELLDELSTPEGRAQVAGIIEYLASDVEATAMFFGFMNTKPFKDMRDALNKLNKDLKEGTKYTEKNTKELAKEITDLSKLADTYSDTKYKSIKENQAKGKEPSERAVHRLAAASSLIRLGQGDLNIAAAENSFAESLNIVKGDIETAREKLTGKVLTSAEQNTLKHLDNASEVLSNYINSDPVIKDQLGAKAPEKQPEAAKPELKAEEKQTLEETGFLK